MLATSEEKSGDLEDRICRESDQVFYHFRKYHMKILLGDFKAKVWREGISKLTVGNEGLRQDTKDDDFRIVNLTISKSVVVKNMMFPHRNIRKYTRNSPDGI